MKKRFIIDGEMVRTVTSDNNTYFTTNSYGEGVFFVDITRNNRKQLTGTCQFSVCGLKPESKKDKLRRFLAERGL